MKKNVIVKLCDGGFGLKSKTGKWFATIYPNKDVAELIASKINKTWKPVDDSVNFSWDKPFMPYRGKLLINESIK